MPVTGKLKIKISVAYTKEFDLSTPKDPLSLARQISIGSAVGADYPVDQVWHDRRTLADGASETLDLTASLTDAFGDTVSFSNLKGMYIRNNSTEAYLRIGGAASNALTLLVTSDDLINLPPQGVMYFQFERADGFIVSIDDQLKITHDGSGSDSLTYDIVLVGHTTQPTPTPTATPTPSPSPTPTPTPT